MNFLFRIAKERNVPLFGYQHEDVEAEKDTMERLLAITESLVTQTRRWAVAFTKYDILSIFNLSAVEDVGEWDTWFPNPNYDYDVDWFRRAELKGYELVETGLQVRHLEGGSVTRKHPGRKRIHDVTFPMNRHYYAEKWGGPRNQEKYAKPWNIQ
jgi:hypothetical protein